MSIGKRLIDLARSELNSLLDRAATHDEIGAGGHDPDEDLYHRYGISAISDQELEAELERRRAAREAATKAARARAEAPRAARPSARPQSPPPPRPASQADEIRRAYASLEVPPGSDFATVRKAYRTMMRKYHPDRHAQSPQKQKAATELAQKLTQAYDLLEKHLRK